MPKTQLPVPTKPKSVNITIKTHPEIKERLQQLTEYMSQRMGIQLSSTQVLEKIITKCLEEEMAAAEAKK